MKETKIFRKQADKAERMARSHPGRGNFPNYLNLAKAYRSQAEVLKAKRKQKETEEGSLMRRI